jgi:hypothetical protein
VTANHVLLVRVEAIISVALIQREPACLVFTSVALQTKRYLEFGTSIADSDGYDDDLNKRLINIKATSNQYCRVSMCIMNNYLAGSLMGSRIGSTLDIQTCLPVPHVEKNEDVAVGKDFNRIMMNLHQKVSPNEEVVGWYATGKCNQ